MSQFLSDNMSESNLIISGLTRAYPEFKYNTEEMIEALGNKLSEDVKENIYQLGVKNRYFVRPFDRYISKSSERIKSNADGEPISDLCVKVAEKCLSDLNLKKSDITCIVAAYEDNDFPIPLLPLVINTIFLSTFKLSTYNFILYIIKIFH